MSTINRDPSGASRQTYDIIIVGGGIYGAMLMLEASRKGLHALLLDRADFGGNTSFNNLRIVHGGLRYLQSAHLSRFQESVAQRRWMLKTFPDLVFPLPCLMPLYGQLSRNRLTLKGALSVNDMLSRHRNRDVHSTHHLPNGRLLTRAGTIELFPTVRQRRLEGGALWYDAVMPHCHRILIETIRWAVSAGGTALNYVNGDALLKHDGSVCGLKATDLCDNREAEFSARIVVNAAGPDSGRLAGTLGHAHPKLYVPSIAWNLLLNRPPLSHTAVAIQSPLPGSQMYFAHSMDGQLLLGTGHLPVAPDRPGTLEESHLQVMLDNVNSAIPGIQLTLDDVLHVFQGELPVTAPNTIKLLDRPVFVDHSEHGGPAGFYSVSGVKFTTARSTAQAFMEWLLRRKPDVLPGRLPAERFPERPASNAYRIDNDRLSETDLRSLLERMIATESPMYLDDLLFRRADLATAPDKARQLAHSLDLPLPWRPGAVPALASA